MSQDTFAKIQETLSQALGVEPSEVKPDASLTRDLGAESIDFIDIIFRLEKAFDIKIPSGDLFPANLLNDERYVKDGKVTEAGLRELAEKYPYMNLSEFSKNPEVTRLGEQFTVQMVVEYINSRQNTAAGS